MYEETGQSFVYTVSETAFLLRVTETEIVDLMEAGRIPFIMIGEKKRIRHTDLIRFVNGCTPINIRS